MENISDVKIGNNIALLLNKLNKSDTECAKEIGIARPHFTNIKNGKTIPTLTVAFKIALVLDTPIHQVFNPKDDAVMGSEGDTFKIEVETAEGEAATAIFDIFGYLLDE